jgi:hypothetical protein
MDLNHINDLFADAFATAFWFLVVVTVIGWCLKFWFGD